MPTQRKIGAVIGIDGAKEYTRAVRDIVNVTKAMEAGLKSAGVAMQSQTKSIADVTNMRKKLASSIDSYTQKMSKELSLQQEVSDAYTKLNEKTGLYQERLQNVAREFGTQSQEYKEVLKEQARHVASLDKAKELYVELEKEINNTDTRIKELKQTMASLPNEGFFIKQEYLDNMAKLNHHYEMYGAKLKVLASQEALHGKSIQTVTQNRSLLSKQITTLNNQLSAQKQRYEQLATAMRGTPTEEEKKEFRELGVEIQNTTAEINDLTKTMNDLPSDSFMGKSLLFADVFKNTENETTKFGRLMADVGKTLTTAISVPLAGAGVAGVKFASDWETAFTGVKKTVDGTDTQFEKLADQIGKLALSTGSTREEIAAVAAAAGQLGIRIDDVAQFTETVVKLGDATNISSDEGAVMIAQFLNIMQDGTETVGDFGNALVELGNNMATDENSILMLATRLASAGKLVGLTTPEVLGLAAAMSSVGLTAEAGGTAMSTTMKMISKEVATGGENLELFGQITGQTAEEFAEKWRSKPIEAIQEFIVGLTNLDGGSEAVITMLDELGFAGIRQSDTLQRLTLDYDGLTEAVKMANDEYTNGTALTKEAENRYSDFAVQINQLKESFKMFSSEIGETLIGMLTPAIEKLTELFANLSTWWDGLSEPMQRFILSIAGIVATIGPLLLIGGNFLIWITKVKAAVAALGGMATILAPLTGAINGIGAAITGFAVAHPVLLAITAGVTAFAIAAKEMGLTWEDVKAGLLVVWETTKEAWNLFWGAIGDGVAKIGQFLGELIMNFDTKMGELFSFLGQKAKDAFLWAIDFVTNMVSGISSTIGNVYTAVVNGLSSAWEYISQKVSDAWSWGSDLMSNLASGISSGVSWVVDKVKGVADKIWSYLHFSEPEIGPLRNFNTWMPDMMRQMAKGINDNSWMVEDAISNVAGRMSMSPQTNAFNYGGVVINLNVPEGANGQMLVDEIETELANRTMRRRAVFA